MRWIRSLIVLCLLFFTSMPAVAFVLEPVDASIHDRIVSERERTVIVKARVERGDTFSELGRDLLGLGGLKPVSSWPHVVSWLGRVADLNHTTRARLDRIKPGESYLVPVSREMLSRKDPLLLERIVRLDSQRERNEQETKLARSIERLENELVGFTKTAEGIRGELQKITAARTVAPAPVAVDIYREERAGRADVTLPQDTWPWRAIVAIGIISALIAGVLIVLVTLYRRRSEQVLERDRETGYVHTVAREPLRSEEGSEEEIERVELHQLRDDYERLRQWQTEHTPGYVLEKTVNGVTERFVLDAYRRNKDGKPVREFESPLTTGVGGYVLEDNLTSHMKKNHPELKNRPLPNAA